MMRRVYHKGILLVSLAITLASLVVYATTAFAEPTPQINYQGKLTDNASVTVPDGAYNIRFFLYDTVGVPTTSAIWREEWLVASSTGVNVQNGLFSVMLGSTTPLTSVNFNQPLYLGVEIGSTTTVPTWDGEMSPRKVLGTVPAAFEAQQLGGLGTSSFLRSDQADTLEATSTTSLLTLIQNGAGAILSAINSSAQTVFSIFDSGIVAVGTSTDTGIATSTGLAVYNKDVEILAGSPVEVGQFDTSPFVSGIAIAGSYAYLANTGDGLRIVDISDPTNPVEVGQFNPGSMDSRGVAIAGNYVYLANYNGIEIIDVSDPTNPIGVGSFYDGGKAVRVTVRGSYAYVADSEDGLEIIDISDPINPFKVGNFNDGQFAQDVVVSGNYAYVADLNDGLEIINISNPANPFEVSQLVRAAARGVSVSGTYVYVASADGLDIVDISDPANPVSVAQFDDGGTDRRGVTVVGNYAYVAEADDGIGIVDISSSTNPFEISQFFDSSGGAVEVVVVGNYAYVADSGDGLEILKLPGLITPTAEIGNLLANDIQSDFMRVTQALSVDGGLNVATNAMIGGSLTITGTASSSLQAGNTNAALTVMSGRVGIGTTTPYADLSVAGDIALTGALYDSSSATGSPGYILQSTGTGVEWVATSTLGLPTIYFTDAGDITYLTSLTDVLAIGTTTDIATSTGLAVYNRDIEILPGDIERLGGIGASSLIYGLAVSNGFAYTAAGGGSEAMEIFEFSDPTNPTKVGGAPAVAGIYDIALVNNLAITAGEGDAGVGALHELEIFDVSNPTNPIKIGGANSGESLVSVAAQGSLVYVVGPGDDGLGSINEFEIFDISDPTNPIKIGGADTSGPSTAVTLSGNFAFVGIGSGITVFDVSDPTNPIAYESSAPDQTPRDFFIQGNLLYSVSFGNSGPGGAEEFEIFDISNPTNPIKIGGADGAHYLTDLVVVGNYAYVVGNGDDGVGDVDEIEIFDISSSTNPVKVGGGDNARTAHAVAISGNTLLLGSSGTQDFSVYDLGGLITPTAEIGNLLANDISTDFMRVSQALSADGGLNVGTNAMIGGSLTITGTASSSLQAGNTNPALTIMSGTFAIGTTSTSADLVVDGNLALTGGIYDTNATRGTTGQLLQSTGSAVEWVATTTLGLPITYFTDAGDITYLTSLTDVLAIGTTTDIATSTGLAVYNRDIEILAGNPPQVGSYDNGGSTDVVVRGSIAYVADDTDGLEIIDISDPTNPVKIGSSTPLSLIQIALQGNYLYAAEVQSGLFGTLIVFDISDPTNPQQIESVTSNDRAYGITINGNYAYLSEEDAGFRIFDISDPTNLVEVGQYDDGGRANRSVVIGNYAYVADGSDGLEIIDVSDPRNPFEVGSVDDGGVAKDILIHGNFAHIADDYSYEIIDISDPTNPIELADIGSFDITHGIGLAGNYAFMVDGYAGVRVFDVSSSTNPIEVGLFENSNINDNRKIDVSGNYAYVVSRTEGFQIYDLGGLITPTAEIGNLLANDIATDYLRVTQALSADGGLNVGTNAMIGGSLTITGTALYPELQQGLVGHWTFDNADIDLSSSTAEIRDVSGNGNNGDWENDEVTRLAGKLGQALEFDGVSDYITVANEVGNDMTLALWVKSDGPFPATSAGFFGEPFLWSDDAGTANDFIISGTRSGSLDRLSFFTGNPDTTIHGTSDIADNMWHHVAVTRNLSTGAIVMYVDGIQEQTGTSNTNTLNANSNIIIGANLLDALFFEGAMDDVRVYDRVLSAPEIESLYRLGASTTNPGLTVTSGYVGIGTSTPYANLSVDGSLALTGGIYDTNAFFGITGYVLQSTGSAVEWSSTSVLGFDTSLFTDAGDITYLTDLTDEVLAIGTTTDIATSTGVAVYNRDVEILAGNPIEVGQFNDGGSAWGITVDGDYAYVAEGGDGVEIIDISDPTNPVEVTQFHDGGNATGLTVVGSYLYVADQAQGLEIIDISNPTNPIKVGQFYDGNFAWSVAVVGNYAYMADYSDGLEIIDISDPTNPFEVGQFDDGGIAYGITVVGNYAYLADDTDGLEIIDISDPTNPFEVGSYYGGSGSIRGVAVDSSYAYIGGLSNGLEIIDVSNPTNPTQVSRFDDGGSAWGVTVVGNNVYVADGADGLEVIDISSSTNPFKVGQFDDGGDAYDVVVSGNYAYLADQSDGLEIFDLGGLITPTAEIGNLLANDIQTDFMRVSQALTVDGGLNVGTNALIGGSLTITGTASSSLQAGNTNPALTILSGTFAIGTTSTSADLVVDGDLALTGGIYDTNATLGTTGQVLQSTGSAVTWVATSSLNIPTSPFTNASDITYLTSLTDVLAIGTTTDIATSTGLAVYNRDIEILPGAPTKVGGIDLDGWGKISAFVQNDYVYVGGYDGGNRSFEIVNVSDKTNPIVSATLDLSDTVEGVYVEGDYAYLATRNGFDYGNLHIYDVSVRNNPILVSSASTSDYAADVVVSGNYAYVVSTGDAGFGAIDEFEIFNISDPTDPRKVGGTELAHFPTDIQVRGSYAYVTTRGNGDDLEIINISDPANPVKVGGVNYDAFGFRSLDIDGNIAYLGGDQDEILLYDISDPAAPVILGSHSANDTIWDLKVVGNYVYAVTWNSVNTLEIFNIASSTNPYPVASAPLASWGYAIDIQGNYAFVASEGTGHDLEIFDLGGLITPTAEIGNLLANDIQTGFARVSQALMVDGGLNVGGNAMIGGSLTIVGIASSSLQSGNTNTALTITSGAVSVGTTTSLADLTIDGNLAFSGGLYDNNASLGATGQVLRSTGTGVEWVATSTLSTALWFTDGGDITYLTSLTDVLAIGTTTDIATSTGLAVYNRDIEILPGNPIEVGQFDDGGSANNVIVVGNYAYVADGSDGLEIIDINDPDNPVEVGGANVSDFARAVVVEGNYAYVVSDSTGDDLEIFDISNPANPNKVGGINAANTLYDVEVAGAYAYVVGWGNFGSGGLEEFEIFNISNPTNPVKVGGTDIATAASAISVLGNYAYVVSAATGDGLEIFDISDPTNPTKVGGADAASAANDVTVAGNYAYVVTSSTGDDLEIFDISDPTNPVKVGGAQAASDASGVTVAGNYAYVVSWLFDPGLEIFDISSSTNPKKVGEADTGSDTVGVTIAGNYAYVAAGDEGLLIFDLGGLITPTAEIGNLLANDIETGFLRVTQALISDSLNVNTNALIGGALSITGTASSSLIDGNQLAALTIRSGFLDIGTTTATSGIRIGYGAICVDNDGECSATTTGRISSVSSYTGNSDLAETYFSADPLTPGTIVSLVSELSVQEATTSHSIIGVVSTKPGILLGFDDTSTRDGERQYPIALAGRIPVKVSTENGPINPGDQLMLSSLPGTAMKATGTGAVIGIALETFDTDRYYSTTYINQYGDDLMDTPENQLTLEELANTPAETTPLEDEPEGSSSNGEGEREVYVGQIVMLVDLSYRYLDETTTSALVTLMGTTTEAHQGTNPEETIFTRLRTLAESFVDGVLSVLSLNADRAQVTEVCVDENTCIDETELLDLLEQAGVATATSTPSAEAEAPEALHEPAPTSTNPTDVPTTTPTTTASTTSIEATSDDSATTTAPTTETEEVAGDTVDGATTTSLVNSESTEVDAPVATSTESGENTQENNDGIP